MMNKVMETGKKLVEKAANARGWLLCAGMYGVMKMNTVICYAESKGEKEGNKITNKFDNLTDLIKTIIMAGGVIYLAKSIFEFASAFQQSDSSGINSAVKGILGALMMISIGTIISFLK